MHVTNLHHSLPGPCGNGTELCLHNPCWTSLRNHAVMTFTANSLLPETALLKETSGVPPRETCTVSTVAAVTVATAITVFSAADAVVCMQCVCRLAGTELHLLQLSIVSPASPRRLECSFLIRVHYTHTALCCISMFTEFQAVSSLRR